MSVPDLDRLLSESVLPFVHSPGQYIGGEVGSVRKDPAQVRLRVALAFPDTYAIGMSHLGLQILYAVLNGMEDVACERVFAPWSDMRERMKPQWLWL